VKELAELIRHGRTLRTIGFDDAPHRPGDEAVGVCGVLCRDDRLEGVLWSTVPRDGHEATVTLARMLLGSRFRDQASVLLLDGVTVAGLDVVDLVALHEAVERPVVAVLRKPPDVDAFDAALGKVEDADVRRARWARAGPLHAIGGHVFHAVGADPWDVAAALVRLCVLGRVPEPLRLAHVIAGGVARGESRGRA
jgi:endonuclease V-like protein UPF0215 family